MQKSAVYFLSALCIVLVVGFVIVTMKTMDLRSEVNQLRQESARLHSQTELMAALETNQESSNFAPNWRT